MSFSCLFPLSVFCYYCDKVITTISPFRYKEDDTSPSFFDPMNPQDYTYSIISKDLLLGSGGKVDKQIKKTAGPESVLTNTTNTTNTN